MATHKLISPISLGNGIPIEFTDCVPDETESAWVGQGAFDSVHLISDAAPDKPGIDIEYAKSNDFRASFPVLEWQNAVEDTIVGMNCYGWGTARSFDGGMYAVANGDGSSACYAEYSSDGVLISYMDLVTECTYNAQDQLIYGTEPEGYVNPVVH